jgi:hypothetical protein
VLGGEAQHGMPISPQVSDWALAST